MTLYGVTVAHHKYESWGPNDQQCCIFFVSESMLLSEEIKCYFENHVDSQMSVLGHGGSIAGKTGPFFKIVIFDERNRDPYKKNFVYLTGVENAIYYATNPRYHDYNWPAEELRELRETFGPDIV